MSLVLRRSDRIDDPIRLVHEYLDSVTYGPTYYRYRPSTRSDTVTLEDLGMGVLFAGQPQPRAALALARGPFELRDVPGEPLHLLDRCQRRSLVETIASFLDSRPGFQSALATKLLHKKRPHAIPVLDNRAIFGTYLRADWQPADAWPASLSTRDPEVIGSAIEAIYKDVARTENQETWAQLEDHFRSEGFTRIELFDMVWWRHAYPRTDDKQTRGGHASDRA